MPIPSAQPTIIPAVSRPQKQAEHLWLDAIFIDASRREDRVPVTVDAVNFAVDGEGGRIFDEASKRRIRIGDLYWFLECRHCGQQEHEETDHVYEPRNATVRQGVLALYGAVMEIDRLDALRQALQAQWPGVVEAAKAAELAAAEAKRTADAARHKADTVSRLDALLAELAQAKAEATDPEVQTAIDQQIAEATTQREAAVETVLADEAAAVAAEAAAGEAQAAAKDAAEQMLDLRARLAELEF